MTKQGLDFVLAGLKGSEIVTELNIAENQFDDDDLSTICDRLLEGVSLNRLKLNQNEFESPDPFLKLLAQTGAQYTHLDFSRMKFKGNQEIKSLAHALRKLRQIEELALCGILADNQTVNSAFTTNQIVDSLVDLKTLKCLDLSKNKFHSETHDHLLAKLPNLVNIRTLAIS